jgi:hypothetical protein
MAEGRSIWAVWAEDRFSARESSHERIVTMDAATKNTLGFLTVVASPQYGLCGGYLILNPAGRPLEFHCTTPIKPNRAQEILYGPTLESFLYGEQIGRTLIQQGGESPLVVFTDREAALSARDFVSMPLALVLPGEPEAAREPLRGGNDDETDKNAGPLADRNICPPEAGRRVRLDGAHGGPRLLIFEVGRNRIAVPGRVQQDRQLTVERLAGLADSFDLAEPFGRIRDAIEEARQAVR